MRSHGRTLRPLSPGSAAFRPALRLSPFRQNATAMCVRHSSWYAVVVGLSVLAFVAEQFGCGAWLVFERGERGVAVGANEAAAGARGGVSDWLLERDRALVARW